MWIDKAGLVFLLLAEYGPLHELDDEGEGGADAPLRVTRDVAAELPHNLAADMQTKPNTAGV